jgi:hypothetical protein
MRQHYTKQLIWIIIFLLSYLLWLWTCDLGSVWCPGQLVISIEFVMKMMKSWPWSYYVLVILLTWWKWWRTWWKWWSVSQFEHLVIFLQVFAADGLWDGLARHEKWPTGRALGRRLGTKHVVAWPMRHDGPTPTRPCQPIGHIYQLYICNHSNHIVSRL